MKLNRPEKDPIRYIRWDLELCVESNSIASHTSSDTAASQHEEESSEKSTTLMRAIHCMVLNLHFQNVVEKVLVF